MCDKKFDVFYGAERSGARFGGRPQGGRHPPAGGMRDRSSSPAGWPPPTYGHRQDDCAGATELDHARCRGSTGVALVSPMIRNLTAYTVNYCFYTANLGPYTQCHRPGDPSSIREIWRCVRW